MARMRLRDLGITIGTLPTGPHNAITDVPGVWVGHATVIHDEPQVARTGITVIVPREEAIREDFAFAGFHSFNGGARPVSFPSHAGGFRGSGGFSGHAASFSGGLGGGGFGGHAVSFGGGRGGGGFGGHSMGRGR